MDRRPDRLLPVPVGSTPVTTLSLFILLLVFFAVLGANSQWRADRTESVLRGVEEAFGRAAAGPEDGGREAAWQTARAAVQAVGDLLRREFPVAKVADAEGGAAWIVDVPAAELFEAGGTAIRVHRIGLLHRVARILGTPPPGVRYRVVALLALSGPIAAGPGSVERVSAVGAAWIAGGAPADSLSVGLEAGEAGMVRFFFGIETLPADRSRERGEP